MPRRKTPADYHALAEKRGFRWLGPEAQNTSTQTGWECENGHRWEAPYGRIQQGKGCPVCAIERRRTKRRKTKADYRALAEDRGFRWLGPEVPNTQTRTSWQCDQGHRWEAVYGSIQQGTGCPFCAGRAPKTPADYHALATERGFCWLGPEVPKVTISTWWECEEGHRWKAHYNNIQQGTGCPVCAGTLPKTPQDYHALALERGFRWLGPQVPNIQTKTRWECEEGHQWEATYGNIRHGRGCPFCAGNIPRVPADYHALAADIGFRWLGPEVPNTQTKTLWECEEGHQWEAIFNSIQRGAGCPFCAGVAPRTPEDYHALAEERGFRWLGPEVPNVRTKTWWQCEEGHCWEAVYDKVRQGRGCPACAGALPRTPADYHALAAERGFRWLGPEVPSAHDKTSWECEEGHRWEASYSKIQYGTGCPFCAGVAPRTPEDYHALAEERGFRWLGPEVATTHDKTWWECEQEHRWETGFAYIQQGTGCPFCAGRAPKTSAGYHALATERGFRWIGPEVSKTTIKTWWECKEGHCWEAHYNNIKFGRGCPVCVDIVNGARVSQVQRDLCAMLGGELNHSFGRYKIDVALDLDGVAVAIEYDAWYWHGGQEEYDAQRDEEMIAAGWRVLRVRSNAQLPTRRRLDAAIGRLLAGETQVEIVLDDWGIGSTKFDVY
jgi:hypothetical protein